MLHIKSALVAMGLAAVSSAKEATTTETNGVNFYVVGDFGWVQDMTDPNTVFDAINETKGAAEPGSIDDGSFFLSAGDNLYPKDGNNPTDEEFATMMIRKEADDDNTKMLLKKAFRILDCDDSGYLTPDELKDYMVTFGHEDFGGEDAWEMIQDADRNQDGKIDYEEFVEYLMTSGGV